MSSWTVALYTLIVSVLGARAAYGSWPWETIKTWHWTRDEIAYLRAVQENNRYFGVKGERKP
jgi:hypothetical protein